MERLATPPTRKSVYPFSASGKKDSTASMPALNMPDTATPASTRVIFDAPVRDPMNSTSSTPPRAPRKAAKGSAAVRAGQRAAHTAVQSPAPALTPMTLGAARGFPSTP